MKIAIAQQTFGQLAETVWCVDKMTVETALPEDGADERRNVSQYLVKLHDLVYERWSIKCWCNEVENNKNTMRGVYSIMIRNYWFVKKSYAQWNKLITSQYPLHHTEAGVIIH